jgi:cytochrome c553
VAVPTTIYVLANSDYQQKMDAKKPDPSLELSVELRPDWKDEGKRLVQVKGCLDCHGPQLEGKSFIDDPALGTFAGPNLTAHETGLGSNYQVSDWVRSIRYGRNRNGKLLRFMPSEEFSHLSDEDLGKMIVYLRALPPTPSAAPETKVGPMAKIMHYLGKMPLLFSGLNISEKHVAVQSVVAEDSAQYGKYVSASCIGCHNADFTGGPINGVPPSWPEAANITSKGKLKNYSLQDFKNVLTKGVTPEGRQINPEFMPWKATAAMTDVEISSLYKHLKSL